MIESRRVGPRLAPALLLVLAALLGGHGTLPAGATALEVSSGGGQSLPFLPELRGEFATVRYTAGALDRAVRVQARFRPLAQDFSKWDGRPTSLAVVLLSRQEWEEVGLAKPYGLPRAQAGLLALPAWGDAATVELWRTLLEQPLPRLEGTPVRGTAAEASSLLLCDLLAGVEAARVLLAAGGYSAEEPWVGAVMAHALAWGAVLRHEPGRSRLVEELFALLGKNTGRSVSRPLGSFSMSADLKERLWFESRYFAAVGVL